jgi:hypothetical protein
MSGMITKAGPKKFILQGREDPTAAYDAVGKDRAYGSETVGQILAWAQENLDRDERHVLSERMLGQDAAPSPMKTKKILDFLEARLTPQELAAVAKILEAAEAPEQEQEPALSEDARIRWTSAGHYAAHHHALAARATEERERQEKVERKWREYRMKAAAEEDFRKRYPDAPKVLDVVNAPSSKPIGDGGAEFYQRFPEAKRIGHV